MSDRERQIELGRAAHEVHELALGLLAELPADAQQFVAQYLSRMEGEWGELGRAEERQWHVRVLQFSLATRPGGRPFATAFALWMQQRWEWATFPEQRSDSAEAAYRDFEAPFVQRVRAS